MSRMNGLKYGLGVSILGVVSISTMHVLASSQLAQMFTIGLVLGMCLGIVTEAAANLLTGSATKR